MAATTHESGIVRIAEGVKLYRLGERLLAGEIWRGQMNSDDLLVRIFASALQSNLLDDRAGSNLYDELAFQDEDRQIDLFEQIGRLSFVRLARGFATEAQVASMRPGTTLVDLGIGVGGPTADIVSRSEGAVERVIGFDIDPSNIERSGELLRPLGVEFIGRALPFDSIDWDEVVGLAAGGPISVNASFALHHLGIRGKEELLRQISQTKPDVFTLVEPSSEHWSADLLVRLLASYAHFESVRQAIERSSVDAEHRDLVLRFFAREIGDIMRDTPDRFERHESWLFWYRAMLVQGLVPLDFDPGSDLEKTSVVLPGAFNVLGASAHLLTVFAFTSRG